MSTEIHKGFKVSNVNQFMIELAVLKKEIIQSYSNEKIKKDYIIWALDKNKAIDTFNTDIKSFDLYQKYRALFDQNKTQFVLNYDNPYDLSINFFPNLNVGYVISENNEFYDKVLNLKSVEKYDYWNNSDEPDNIDESEWEKRRDIWKKAFKSSTNATYDELISMIVFKEQLMPDIIYVKQDIIESYLKEYVDSASYKHVQEEYGGNVKPENTDDTLLSKTMLTINIHRKYKDQYFDKWIQKYQSQKKSITY